MIILLADECLLFCGQARNQQVDRSANPAGLPALTGASHGCS